MNPLQRAPGIERGHWGRFDVPLHRTIYSATPARASYAEALSVFRLDHDKLALPLSKLFPDSDPSVDFGGETTLAGAIRKDWDNESFYMGTGRMPAGWRLDRLEYKITLPKDGWFVDIERSETLSALQAHRAAQLKALDCPELTREHLLGSDRALTTMLAEWVHALVLDDGSYPLGIAFGSKHGKDYSCFAVWLRALDDGKPLTSEPTTSDDGKEIKDPEHNPPLRFVTANFNLRCF